MNDIVDLLERSLPLERARLHGELSRRLAAAERRILDLAREMHGRGDTSLMRQLGDALASRDRRERDLDIFRRRMAEAITAQDARAAKEEK